MSAIAQNNNYEISKDEKSAELIYNGRITFADLNREPSFTWLKSGADEYKPDEQVVTFLKEKLPQYSFVIFLGTWCDDSHYLIPKLEKVLQEINYPDAGITMYGVNREKTTKGGEEKKYNVTFVPTIILFNKDGKEAGRITESAQKSVEADIADIIQH